MTTENVPKIPDAAIIAGRCGFETSRLPTRDGLELFVRTAQVTGAVQAEMLVTHGLGEHADRYLHLAAALAERGIRVTSYDLRGHGRSSGQRTDVTRYELFLEDLRGMMERVQQSGRPLFLFGHSMGGQVTLRLLQSEAPAVAGAVILSPWIALAFEPPWWKLLLARLALRYRPQSRFPTGMRFGALSRDRAHLEAMPLAELVTHSISARMFFAVRAQGEMILGDSARLRTPLLLAHGDADPITHWRATEELYRRSGAEVKTLKIYADAVHELHNDLVREEVFRDVGDWILARC